MTDKERFGGKCPYNGNPCETFNCNKCAIEEQERKYMEELDKDEKPLLEDVIDWGQGYDDDCTEIIEAFNRFRDGYYSLCAFSNDNWWEFLNQCTDFNELMKSEWDKLDDMDFMGIMERMAIILSGGYIQYHKFAEGVKKCYEQGNGLRHREKEE